MCERRVDAVGTLLVCYVCAVTDTNPTRGSKDTERTKNTVIQCLILNFDLDLQLTLVKHKNCISSHYSLHSCKVICKSNQGFKRYRADIKYSLYYVKS